MKAPPTTMTIPRRPRRAQWATSPPKRNTPSTSATSPMLMDLYDRPFLDCYMEVMAALPAYVAASPLSFSFEAVPLLYGCGLFLAVWLVWLRFSVFIGNYRAGEEAGSARWGTRKEGEAFRNADEPDSNILLTEHYAIATRRKDFDLEHDRNLNVMVIGGSGSGKTRYYVKPNLMQMNASFFVTDPKASLIEEVGGMFADPESGYRLKCFNGTRTASSRATCASLMRRSHRPS